MNQQSEEKLFKLERSKHLAVLLLLLAFSKVFVFGVHTAFYVFESLRFRKSPFSKVSIFVAEQCERKVNADTFLSVFI